MTQQSSRQKCCCTFEETHKRALSITAANPLVLGRITKGDRSITVLGRITEGDRSITAWDGQPAGTNRFVPGHVKLTPGYYRC